ncbi:DUF6850 family outer membrane beta-barrel protein [Myroides fluvii]|uniref:DUF6850 family outer membrane beta-barrel protein n=1 Tax=Myroides fluvii TaxID=2572594 RepID=UPI00131ABBFC|nr:DUF6850 family outer membrane beta-barrel protein [Myroides fluvii]
MNKSSIFWLLFFCSGIGIAQAQDSLSTYNRMLIQQQAEQQFKKDYYYNPVHQLDYSNFSFSDILVGYQKSQSDLYKLQEGTGVEGIQIAASSYKKLSNNRSIWGNVVYQKNTQKELQWNNNLDLPLLGPYVIADSTSNSMKYEAYEFMGGYAKKAQKWSLGLEASYQAHLGYKSRDPRPKSISSHMQIKGGIGYNITPDWMVSTHGLFTNYTQNTQVSFANQTQKAALYQLNGLGTWSRYFSGKSTGTNIERSGYAYGFDLENKALDFVVGMTKGASKLKRFSTGISLKNADNDAETNRLEENANTFYFLKSFAVDDDNITVKYNYEKGEKKGIEVYYTDNEATGLEKLLEKKAYKYTDVNHQVEGLYELNFSKSQWMIHPYWRYQKTTEVLQESASKQGFTYAYYGLNLTYTQTLTATTTLTVEPAVTYRKVNKADNQLNFETTKPAMKDWLLNDFEYLSTDYVYWGATLKYALEKVKKAPMFVAIAYHQMDFKTNKQNNYVSVTLGVTF